MAVSRWIVILSFSFSITIGCDEINDWSSISSCTVTCGGGFYTERRTCYTAWSSRYEYRYPACGIGCCPVNGGWSDWDNWSTCPVTCEGNTNNQYRTRYCTNPAPSCSGSYCPGSDTSYYTCNPQCCPVDGGWATWGEWYACPVTCGTGTQYRYRDCSNPYVYCNGAICPGCVGSLCSRSVQRDTDTNICNNFPCIDCGSRDIGYGNPSLYTSIIGANSEYGVLAESGFYTVTCCGVIKSWEFRSSREGELHLMIWRKAGTSCTLAGKNIYIVPSSAVGHVIKYAVRELDRLTIKDGDMIGWYTPQREIIPYSTDPSYPHNFRLTSMTRIEEGNTYSWSSVAFTHSRAYAIRVFTTDNTAPFFTNLQRRIAIDDNNPVGSYIYKVKYYSGDTRDQLTFTVTSSSTAISFDKTTEYVYLTATPTIGTHTLTFSMTDTCGKTAAGSLTIEVFNSPPRITSLPSSTTIHEDTKEGKLLHTLVIYDRQTSDSITCVLASTNPISTNFAIQKISGTADYGIYLQPNSAFAYNANKQHKLLISCDDGKNTAVTGYFFVNIQKNHPPRFINLPASVDLNASTTLIGDLIFTVRMNDDEDDTLTFTMTTVPANGPFMIKDYGDILTTDDMSNIFTPAYKLKVSVSDGRTTVGTRTLSVHLTNINDKPVITNVPVTHPFLIEENSAIGTTLYHSRILDLDITDTHHIYGAFIPTPGTSLFQLSSDGYLTISSDIDFESISSKSYRIIVTAFDGKDTGTATISLTITDQNEVPVFHQTAYAVEQDESRQNTQFPSAGFVIDDPDVSESLTRWLDCGNDTWRFTMDKTTGIISYAYNYDLDKLLTAQYNCHVRVRDTGFNTDTASLVIKIKDRNDNTPYFNQTQYIFYISPYVAVGSEIGNVTAYDIDVSKYGTITYQLDMTSYITSYVQIYDNGTLYVNEPLSSTFFYGDVMELNLTAVDYGRLETTIKIWIVFPQENTTTTSTTPLPVKFETCPTNMLWFTASGILTSVGILVVCYLCVKYAHSINCVQTTNFSVEILDQEDLAMPEKPNKLKSIDIQRSSGNSIFDRNQSWSLNSNKTISTSLFDSMAPKLSSNNMQTMKQIIQNSTSGKLFTVVRSNLYKEKENVSAQESAPALDFI